MSRSLVAWLPAFRLERCGIDADEVAAVVDERRGAVRVVASTPAARALGIVEHVTATEARALAPDVVLVPFDDDGERNDRGDLLRAAEALSDRVAFAWDDALAVDVAATAGALGGERAAAERALALFTDLGHRVAVAVADDPLAASALACAVAPGAGGLLVHPPGRPLGDVPLLALRPSEALRVAWRAVGLRTCDDLAGLPAASVVGRYGAEGRRLYRVARGEHVGLGEPVDVGTDDEIRVSMPLAGATTRGELRFALPGLLRLLLDHLHARDLAAVRLRVVLGFESGGATLRRVGTVRLGRPTTSTTRIERAILTRLDAMGVDPGGDEAPRAIDELRLEVEEAASEAGWQPGLTDRAEHREPLPDLLARLCDTLGAAALIRPELSDVWRPEAAWRAGVFPAPRWGPRRDPAPDDPVATLEHHEQAAPPPRPTLLLPEPERLEVELDAGGPCRIRLPTTQLGRGEAPSWLGVARRAGPERLWGEWWTSAPLDREYWVVEVDGRAAWLFRDERGWALHGWFD